MMDYIRLKGLATATALLLGNVNAWADTVEATLVHTASVCNNGSTTDVIADVDSTEERYNYTASGNFQGFAFAEFSFQLPEGHCVSKAELTWTTRQAGRANTPRNHTIRCLNPGLTLDYGAIPSATRTDDYRLDDQVRTVATETFADGGTRTTDVTTALQELCDAGQRYAIFQWTNNAAGAYLSGMASEQHPTLVLTTIDASMQTTYTVRFVDAGGTELKSALQRTTFIGEALQATEEDMQPFYVDQQKYAYESGNTSLTATADASQNVITLVFRPLAWWQYTAHSRPEGYTLSGAAWEGSTLRIPYPEYLPIDGLLYTRPATEKNFFATKTLEYDGEEFVFDYNVDLSLGRVVYLAEAETIEGATSTSINNADIRCSMMQGAYNATGKDLVLTTLPAGTYTIWAQVWGNVGQTLTLTVGNDSLNIATKGYLFRDFIQVTLTEPTPLKMAPSGDAYHCLDWVMVSNQGGDGYAFSAPNPQGLDMKFRVLSEEDKTVEVYGEPSKGFTAIKESHLHTTVVPEEVNGYRVTAISDYAFSNSSLHRVVLPSSITSIGAHAFEQNYMSVMNLPEGVTRVGDYAFANGMPNSITLPQSLTAMGRDAFASNDAPRFINSNIRKPFFNTAFTGATKWATLYVPRGTRHDYLKTNDWNTFYEVREGKCWDFSRLSIWSLNALRAEARTVEAPLPDSNYKHASWRAFEHWNDTDNLQYFNQCFWWGDDQTEGNTLRISGLTLPETEGIAFTQIKAGGLAILTNRQNDISLNDCLWMAQADQRFVLSGLQGGDTIFIDVESHVAGEAYGLNMTIDGSEVAPIQGSTNVTARTTCAWVVSEGHAETEVTFTNNGSCHLYYIRVAYDEGTAREIQDMTARIANADFKNGTNDWSTEGGDKTGTTKKTTTCA